MSSVVTTNVANSILDGIVGIQSTRRNFDSSTDERRCITLSPERITELKEQFPYNNGLSSDGKPLTLKGPTIYLRVPVNIHMIEQTQTNPNFNGGFVYSVKQRAEEGKASLQVFVDGYKIPDEEILFYPTRTNVDVFIPNTYINSVSGSEIIVEKKRYDFYPYIHTYEKDTSLQLFTITVPEENQKFINEKSVLIFINKKLYTYTRSLTFNNDNLSIRIESEVPRDSTVEIVVDPYISYMFPQVVYPQNSTSVVFEIPETYIDSIHGPISKFSCSFYVNGLRIPNTSVIQKGRLHFQYDLPSRDLSGGTISFYLSDRNYVTDEAVDIFGSDYYLYNFIGCSAISSALKTTFNKLSRYLDAGANRSFTMNIDYSRGAYSASGVLPDYVLLNMTDSKQTIKVSVITRDVNGIEILTKTEIPSSDYSITKNPEDKYDIIFSNPELYFNYARTNEIMVDISSWYKWDEVLNHSGTLFDRQLVKQMISEFDFGYDQDVRAITFLHTHKDHPHVMRNFLENYGYDIEYYSVDYNGNDAYVYIGLDEHIDTSTGKSYDISINNNHIPNEELIVINKDVTDVFQIPGKYFKKGSNNVDIQIVDIIDVEYKQCKLSDIRSVDGFQMVTVDANKYFPTLGDWNENIIILEKINDGDSEDIVNFPTSSGKGYKLFSDEYYTLRYENNTLYILFTITPTNDFVIYNKNFSTTYRYTKPTTETVADVKIPIYFGSTNDPIPYIPRGKVFVYNGGEKLIENVDYFVKHPENDETVAGSFIIMKKTVLPGSSVDIYFTNFKTNVVFSYSGYFQNNRYGLFYLGSLRYPFSLKYMNLYINGKKLNESDVDILSDKLIRIHSMEAPLYDLAVESAFTLDDSELEPFIREYEPDNFEKYLAWLFRAVDYTREYSEDSDESDAYDPNEIYEEFIDTVDSVFKKPNPIARNGVWIPSYNGKLEDPAIGPYNDGTAMDGNDIKTSLLVGNQYVVAGVNGKVASCYVDNVSCDWTPCTGENAFEGAIFSDGTIFNNETITSMTMYHGYLLFGTEDGRIVAYDTTAKVWYGKDEIELTKTKWPEGKSINGIYAVSDPKDMLIICGEDGYVDSFVWDELSWNGTSDNEIHYNRIGIGLTNVLQNDRDIYGMFETTQNGKKIYIFVGEDGCACSCNPDYNSWIYPDGRSFSSVGGGAPHIYNNGTDRDNKDILSVTKYFNYYILGGEEGVVTYYDTELNIWVKESNLNIYNNGQNLAHQNIWSMQGYNDKYIFAAGGQGRVSEYFGSTQSWFDSDSGNGITSDGKYIEGRNIYTSVITSGDTSYIIFAGEDGKVCSYNIDEHEVPFRYDTFKSVFLKWYTTEGNARIQSKWDIPRRIERMFDMYKESNTGTGDICIRGGDDDLMMDIFMNDFGKYPWTLEARRRFIAQFIHDLPEGRYTLDEVLALYRESRASNMLYEEDLTILKSGDLHDLDETLLVTEEP